MNKGCTEIWLKNVNRIRARCQFITHLTISGVPEFCTTAGKRCCAYRPASPEALLVVESHCNARMASPINAQLINLVNLNGQCSIGDSAKWIFAAKNSPQLTIEFRLCSLNYKTLCLRCNGVDKFRRGNSKVACQLYYSLSLYINRNTS